MKVKELIEQLQKFDPEDGVEIYITEESTPLIKLSSSYLLCDIKVTKYEGWSELVTLEIKEIMGW